ncbi:MAG: class I SAM-dependent methyltransferase [Brachymonas sp.]|nr:class I SAM-dependent methyltransferase [Brachymonas sp.]
MDKTQELQERIRRGWQISAEGYSGFIVDELQDGTAEHWRADLSQTLAGLGQPGGQRRVLDVGTGPGLFAILLAQEGWDVTAIDGSPNMLAQAQQNARRCGVSFAAQQMEAQQLAFADESFDAIVNRNVMWTVADPLQAYREFFRVLAPGGRLLVYDGDHLADLRDPAIATEKQRIKEEFLRKHGQTKMSFKPEQYEEARGWRTDLPLAQERRPQWDEAALASIGFENIGVRYVDQALVPRTGHGGSSQDFAPMFALTANKPLR